MGNNTKFEFDVDVVTALRPASVFSIEGGRLAAIERPIWGELCPKQGPNSASQSIFGFTGRSQVMGNSVTDARTYTFRTGSNALGGSG